MTSRRVTLVLGIALFIVGAVAFAFLLQHWLEVDRCLDAGGSYNYSQQVCDLKESHPVQGVLASIPAIIAMVGMGLGVGLISAATVKKHAL
jgi:MFS family permease